MITRDEKIKALKREIALRKSVFPRRIKMGLMEPDQAEREIAIVTAILHDYMGDQNDEYGRREQ